MLKLEKRIRECPPKNAKTLISFELPPRELKLCSKVLDDLIDQKKYYGALVIQSGQVIVQSNLYDSRVNALSFASNIQTTFDIYQSENRTLGKCSELKFEFPQVSVFIRELGDFPSVDRFWLLVSLNSSNRHFKGKINTVALQIYNIISSWLSDNKNALKFTY